MVQPWDPPSFDSEVLPGAGGARTRPSSFEQGRESGYAKGMADGYAAGFDQGREEGRAAAYKEARAEVAQLTQTLQSLLGVLKDLPEVVGADLSELAFEIGLRLAGSDGLERGPFVAAVQEALMRLPRPGERLFVRLCPAEVEAWQAILQDPALPCSCDVQVDPAVEPGHAWVEIDGARINIGALARRAVLRMALGLPLESDEKAGEDAAGN